MKDSQACSCGSVECVFAVLTPAIGKVVGGAKDKHNVYLISEALTLLQAVPHKIFLKGDGIALSKSCRIVQPEDLLKLTVAVDR